MVGLGYCYLLVRMVRGVARATASAVPGVPGVPGVEFQTVIDEPMTDFILITTIVGVLALIAAGVVAIVVALADRAH
jgi:hypothetical protein